MAEIVRRRRRPVPLLPQHEAPRSHRSAVTGSDRRSPRDVQSGMVRTCIGCRRRDERSALLRVVAVTREGSVAEPVPVWPDPRGRLDGRGAWLHPVAECVEQAERRRAFVRALRVGRGVDITAVREFIDMTDASEPDPNGPVGNKS